MIVIRRLVDKQRAYTGIFLPGMPAKIFPTSDMEHARILAIYKQERPHEGIINDFSDYALGSDHLPPVYRRPDPPPSAPAPVKAARKKPQAKKSRSSKAKHTATPAPSSLWLSIPGRPE